jgi:hypothetical protein
MMGAHQSARTTPEVEAGTPMHTFCPCMMAADLEGQHS